MARPVRPWFRFYTEAFGDRKLRRLKPEYRWLFAACLGAARQSPEPGVLLVSEGQPMDLADLADYAGMDVRSVKAGMRALSQMGLIVERSHGDLGEIAYTSPSFQKRQYESDDVTKRTRKHRANAGNADQGTFQPRSPERSRNGDGNAPETETETETEEEQGGTPPTARKRAHQLPPDFAPNETNRRIAKERGVDLRAAFEQFRDHHLAKGSTMKDWHLAFNTWLRRERPGVQVVAARHLPDARDLEPAPSGMTDEESAAWMAEQIAKRRRA